ncbi:beta-xylosidase-like [Bradysia coprophila]|uniref:beta-xylosidase-like n=1 Tax=Bradysia coprophila TaxID=38358 RepID=UPI00187D9A8F|nr:beta-xylosidase-like [Bradysia coprophila]
MILIFLILSCLQFSFAENPVFPGYYADPEGIVYGDKYWIFPTYSAEYEDQTFFDAFSSYDMVNWTKHSRIIDSNEVAWAERAMWAPAVLEKSGKYYLFFAANDVYEGDIGGIGVAVADQPEGPYKDLIGKPLINDIVNGAQPIDQYVFTDMDGQMYMYYGGWGHCNMVKMNENLTAIVPFPDGQLFKEVTPQNYIEGPFMFIRNEKYYFMWSEGGWGGPNYKVAYAIATSPFGPFERIATILEQDENIATGAGHHSVIKVPGQDKYYIVYHRRPLGDNGRDSRVTCVDEMKFNEDGTIIPVKMTFDGVVAPLLSGGSKIYWSNSIWILFILASSTIFVHFTL